MRMDALQSCYNSVRSQDCDEADVLEAAGLRPHPMKQSGLKGYMHDTKTNKLDT